MPAPRVNLLGVRKYVIGPGIHTGAHIGCVRARVCTRACSLPNTALSTQY